MTAPRKYPHNVLEGFGNGALLDLRVRLAMQMLTHSPMYASSFRPYEGKEITAVTVSDDGRAPAVTMSTAPTPQTLAKHALDLAHEVLSQADARGWVEPIPDLPEIDGPLKDQAHRTAEYQARQQVHGNAVAAKMMTDDAPKVIPMQGGRH